MKTIFVVAVLSVFALLPARSEASPTVVYNNFGPGQSYSPGFYFLAGPNSAFPEQAVAAPFTPTTTTTFDSVLLPVGFFTGINDGLRVSLVPDVGGEPGSTPLLSLNTGQLFGGIPGGAVVDLAWNDSLGVPDPVLTAGTTYWITVIARFFSIDEWFENSTGADVASGSGDDGLSWVPEGPSTPVAPAFEVLGDAVSTPEPSAFAMLAGLAGMGAIVLTRVRRQQAAAHSNRTAARLWLRGCVRRLLPAQDVVASRATASGSVRPDEFLL